MNRILNVFLAAVAIGVLWVAVHQYHRANVAVAALAKMRREQLQVPVPSAAAGSRPPVEPQPRVADEPAPDAAVYAEQQRQRAITKAKKEEALEDADAQREIRATAAMQQLDFDHMRASLPAHFAPLYTSLQMTADDIKQFESILTEKYRTTRAVEAARDYENRGPPDDPDHLAMLDQAAEPFDERIRGLLGEAGFERYQRQETTAGVRPMLQSFVGLSALSAAPLTPQQADQVAEVLNASLDLTLDRNARWVRPRNWTDLQARGISDNPNLGWSDINMEAALPQLKTVLTPTQLDSLRSLHQQEFTRKRASDIYKRTVREQQLERQHRARESTLPASAPPR